MNSKGKHRRGEKYDRAYCATLLSECSVEREVLIQSSRWVQPLWSLWARLSSPMSWWWVNRTGAVADRQIRTLAAGGNLSAWHCAACNLCCECITIWFCDYRSVLGVPQLLRGRQNYCNEGWCRGGDTGGQALGRSWNQYRKRSFPEWFKAHLQES